MLVVLLLSLAGIDHGHSLLVGSANRSFTVHTPTGYSASSPLLPVVVCFHALAQDGRGIARMSGFSQLADKEKFLVVYPEGVGRSWNAGSCCNGNRQDDVGFAVKLVSFVVAKYRADSKRVYSTGFSNGAMLCHRLTAERPALFAASASVAGCLKVEAVAVGRPVMMIHGMADRVVHLYDAERTSLVWSCDLRKHPGGHVWPADAASQCWGFLKGR